VLVLPGLNRCAHATCHRPVDSTPVSRRPLSQIRGWPPVTVMRAALPAYVGVTERHISSRCIGASESLSSKAGQDITTAGYYKTRTSGRQWWWQEQSCRHQSPQIAPLNPSCTPHALVQPMSLYLILVPENPCSTRADRSLRLEAFIIRLVGLTLSPHLRIRDHKFIQSHDLNRRTAAWKLLDYSIVDSNQVGQARITYASEPRAIH